MRAPISVVIPTLNSEAGLALVLRGLGPGLAAGVIREVIVSDGGSQDGTLAVAEAAGCVLVQGAASRGGQLRRGCAAAAGDWLMILHADSALPKRWPEVVMAQVARGRPAAFRLGFRARGVMAAWVAGWANLRSRLFGLPYGDQGLVVSRAQYAAAGGYPDQPLMEDVALVRALAQTEARVEVMGAVILTGAERYLAGGWLRRGARNLWTLMRYFAGVSPEALAAAYRKR